MWSSFSSGSDNVLLEQLLQWLSGRSPLERGSPLTYDPHSLSFKRVMKHCLATLFYTVKKLI